VAEQTKTVHDVRHKRRFRRLILISVVGMGCLGVLAMSVALIRTAINSGLDRSSLLGPPLAFITGCTAGALSAAVVVPCLLRVSWRLALPLVYGVSAIVVIVYAGSAAGRWYPLDASVPALISVIVLSIVARIALPQIAEANERVCPECEYDLKGIPEAGCPECGWGRTDSLREK